MLVITLAYFYRNKNNVICHPSDNVVAESEAFKEKKVEQQQRRQNEITKNKSLQLNK